VEYLLTRKFKDNGVRNKLDMHNYNAYKAIKDGHGKFAAHMFDRNRLVEMFALSELGGLDLLEQPMCTKCEKPILFSEYGATCPVCGTNVPRDKIVTLRQYLAQEFKRIIPDDQISELVEGLEIIFGEDGEIDDNIPETDSGGKDILL
jgi:hypothetical protein